MGIQGVERCLYNDCPGGFSKVNILDLVSSTSKRKVIVVDGNQFIGRYLYKKFQWIYGGIVDYIQEIRLFVEKFQEIGVELVFFLYRNVTEPSKRAIWIKNRIKHIENCQEVIYALENGIRPPARNFKNKPVNVKYMTMFFLHKVMQCEIHCSVNFEKDSVIYAAEQNCLAILSQNSFYVFHPNMPAYLSMKALNIEEMTIVQYNIDAFREHVRLEQEFFPLLATIVGENVLKVTNHPREVARENVIKAIYQKMEESKKTCHFVCVSKFIRNHFEERNMENIPMFLTEQFGTDGETLIASYEDFKERFSLEKLQPSSPETSWQKVVEEAQRLLSSGEMNGHVCDVLIHSFYEHDTILENFEEFEGSGVIYRLLRQQLYGILCNEAPENSPQTITEWCASDDATTNLLVVPATINLHPGLLSLWDTKEMSHDLQSKRWKISVDAFAPTHNLDYKLFSKLPQNLVVPSAVLFYLQHEVPKTLKCEKILEPWEVELFIAIGMILSKKEKDICKIKISPRTTNIRAVKLSALFMCGCLTVNLLVQARGLRRVIDSELFHYFDGKLFHNLYEKAKWNHDTQFLESEVMLDSFQEIKGKILLMNSEEA